MINECGQLPNPMLSEVVLIHMLSWNGQEYRGELKRFESELYVFLLNCETFTNSHPGCLNELSTHWLIGFMSLKMVSWRNGCQSHKTFSSYKFIICEEEFLF